MMVVITMMAMMTMMTTMMMTIIMTTMIAIMTMITMMITTMMTIMTMMMMVMMRGREEWIAQEINKKTKQHKTNNNNKQIKEPSKPVKCQVKCARPFVLAGVTGRYVTWPLRRSVAQVSVVTGR